jgi:hypothetical protein
MQIMEIFHKIGSKSTAQQGLDALYDLLEANPDLPVDSLMERTSPNFQRYISKGLDRVRPHHLLAVVSIIFNFPHLMHFAHVLSNKSTRPCTCRLLYLVSSVHTRLHCSMTVRASVASIHSTACDGM